MRMASGLPTRIKKRNQFDQFSLAYTILIHTEDLGWPHFDNETRFQEKT